MTVLIVSPAAYSKGKKKKAEAEPTATLTPTPTPTPEVHVWNFDSDKAGEVPAGWKAVEGEWQVIRRSKCAEQAEYVSVCRRGA